MSPLRWILSITLVVSSYSIPSPGHKSTAHGPESTLATVENRAETKIWSYWLGNGKLVKQFGSLKNGSTFGINTYLNHRFVFNTAAIDDEEEYFKDKKSCKDCVEYAHTGKEQYLLLTKNKESDDASSPSINLEVTDTVTIEERLLAPIVEDCDSLTDPNEFKSCFLRKLDEKYDDVQSKRRDIHEKRKDMSDLLRNYTCSDRNATTTEAKSTLTWTYGYHTPAQAPVDESKPGAAGGTAAAGRQYHRRNYDISVLHNSSHAMIISIKDFLDEETCNRIKDKSARTLTKAAVSDLASDSGATYSAYRRAMAGSATANPSNPLDRPIQAAMDRVLSFANHYTTYNLRPQGQESFTVIKYDPTDEYRPHCDGACDGSLHRPGGRVATMVMYCDMPPQPHGGGYTTFTRANVLVVPKKYDATFFAYRGADGRMDEGLTLHSGCPVYEGEKWIVTQWLRDGVSERYPAGTWTPTGDPLYGDLDYEDVYEKWTNKNY